MPPPRKRMPDTPLKKQDLGLEGELKKRRRKNKIVVYFTSKQVSCASMDPTNRSQPWAAASWQPVDGMIGDQCSRCCAYQLKQRSRFLSDPMRVCRSCLHHSLRKSPIFWRKNMKAIPRNSS
eukprot:scaffold436_cov336-Pavlova_lutheri.AAC.28